MNSRSASVWVWCPVDNEEPEAFVHPAELPCEDAAARQRFIDGIRGPQFARISPAALLQIKGDVALISEKGSVRWVPRSMLLKWYEGLLLLEELDSTRRNGHETTATWFEQDLQALLEQERGKHKNGRLSSALYVERFLATTAVTGSLFVDSEERVWAFRREHLRADNHVVLVNGADGHEAGFHQVREITGYLPPWEAVCHEKCGFYQDFYRVQWANDVSPPDYSGVENSCSAMKGATWEPDECLPSQLDSLRIAAKKAWIKAQREHEQHQAAERSETRPVTCQNMDQAKRALVAPLKILPVGQIKRTEFDAALTKDSVSLKRARKDFGLHEGGVAKICPVGHVKRDGTPLNRDILNSRRGHDLQNEQEQQPLNGIRDGWPKYEHEYPTGYACCEPPGYCWDGCDCMDDQRPQRSWETFKPWLEDAVRSSHAAAAIDAFSSQSRWVRKRGAVSKMFFFETAQTTQGDKAHSEAALYLADTLQKSIRKVLGAIPFKALLGSKDRVFLPVGAFLANDFDYFPLRFAATLLSGEPLPAWFHIDAATGQLSASTENGPPDFPPEGLGIQVELRHAEGRNSTVTCVVMNQGDGLWTSEIVPLINRLNDRKVCFLDQGVRSVLNEHFSELYDFKQHVVHDLQLGEWLRVMERLLRMLRSSAVAHLSHRAQTSVMLLM